MFRKFQIIFFLALSMAILVSCNGGYRANLNEHHGSPPNVIKTHAFNGVTRAYSNGYSVDMAVGQSAQIKKTQNGYEIMGVFHE